MNAPRSHFFLRWCALLLLLLAGGGAHAAITCTSITSPGFNTAYVANTTQAMQITFTITCSRGSVNDPTSINYSVFDNNGTHATGNANAAALVTGRTTNKINYDFYTTGCGGTQWAGFTTITGTVTWNANQTGNATDDSTFWACINAPQTPTASGVFTDSVTLTALYNGFNFLSATVPVNIYAPANCTISPAPGNISITYPAFSPIALTGSTTFGANCTQLLPYTLSVSPASGTLSGVNYNVTLSAPGGTGDGTRQTYTVTVTAPPNQGGTCAGPSCTQTQTHTLTLTY
jgi:hypothetical protein